MRTMRSEKIVENFYFLKFTLNALSTLNAHFKCMDFLALRRSFSTKIPNFFFFGQNPSTTSPDMGLKGGLVKKSLAVALAAVSKGHTSKRAVFGGKKFRL